MSHSILTIGSAYLLMPTEQALRVFKELGNPLFVDDDYANGFKHCDQKYKRVRLQHISDTDVFAMDAKRVLEE